MNTHLLTVKPSTFLQYVLSQIISILFEGSKIASIPLNKLFQESTVSSFLIVMTVSIHPTLCWSKSALLISQVFMFPTIKSSIKTFSC